jgi:hypothetical protein
VCVRDWTSQDDSKATTTTTTTSEREHMLQLRDEPSCRAQAPRMKTVTESEEKCRSKEEEEESTAITTTTITTTAIAITKKNWTQRKNVAQRRRVMMSSSFHAGFVFPPSFPPHDASSSRVVLSCRRRGRPGPCCESCRVVSSCRGYDDDDDDDDDPDASPRDAPTANAKTRRTKIKTKKNQNARQEKTKPVHPNDPSTLLSSPHLRAFFFFRCRERG